jgi:hypothetical protein
MKTRLIAVTVVALVLALPMALDAQEADPASVVTALYEAFNAGDGDAAAEIYSDDAIVRLVDWDETYAGGEEIRVWVQELVAANFLVEVESLEAEGDTVTVAIRAWADPTRGLGIAPLESTDVYTVKDGRITSQTTTLTAASLDKFMAAMAALPVTGGERAPASALAMAIGGLAILVGLGPALLGRLRRQQR